MSDGKAVMTGLALAGTAVVCAATAAAQDIDLRFAPSAANPELPDGWSEQALSGSHPVRYTLAAEDGDWIVHAESNGATSTLVRKLDLAADFVLSWRWKVNHSIATADLRRRDGDDFAGRVYVLFDAPVRELSWSERLGLKLEQAVHGRELPTAGLSYVWDNRAPIGTVAASAYTSRVQLIVLESGDRQANAWRQEARNLAADYRMAFGRAAPRIHGIALMSDTDNTHSQVSAWYADFALHAADPHSKPPESQPQESP